MKRLIASIALAIATAMSLTACEPPDDHGRVIDKRWHGEGDRIVYELEIEFVTAHNRGYFWWVVDAAQWASCDIGDEWRYLIGC